MTDDEKASFICVGSQKCGTTALYEYLRQHSNLQIAPCKEIHFFDDEKQVDWIDPDYDVYHDKFGTPDGRLRGELTPIYMYWPQSMERIKIYRPSMRIIMIFRDPVERAYSQWRMEIARAGDDRPFAWAIRQGRARVDDVTAPGHHRVYSYVERGFYARQIERAYNLFSKDHVLTLAANDLKSDPNTTLDRICDFLGVPNFPNLPSDIRANVGHGPERLPPISAEDRSYLHSIYEEDQARLAALTGLRL